MEEVVENITSSHAAACSEKQMMTLELLEQVICSALKVGVNVPSRSDRRQETCLPRHLFFYFANKYKNWLPQTSNTIVEIGKYYGRNHGTVVFACKKIEGYTEINRVFREQVSEIDTLIRESFLSPIS